MNLTAAAVLAVSYVALIAAHEVADYWLQTPCQALTKGGAGWKGRAACARHVVTLTTAKVAALLAAFAVTGLPIRPLWWTAGLGIDAASHYWADRRTTLRRLAVLCGPGKAAFYGLGAPRPGRGDNVPATTGAALLDQAWHKGWLFLTVLILAGGAW
jgi:hypothetical protein